MGEHYEAYRLASALANGDINDASNTLIQDAQRMDPPTFSYMLNDANQQSAAANPNSDQLQLSSDQNGLPVVNFVNPNNQIDQQISLPQQPMQSYDAPPPPEEYQPTQTGGQYPPPPEEYPPPPPYYGNAPQEYNPNQCAGQTVLGAALGALAGGLLTGGRSRGIGMGAGAIAGGVIAGNNCR